MAIVPFMTLWKFASSPPSLGREHGDLSHLRKLSRCSFPNVLDQRTRFTAELRTKCPARIKKVNRFSLTIWLFVIDCSFNRLTKLICALILMLRSKAQKTAGITILWVLVPASGASVRVYKV